MSWKLISLAFAFHEFGIPSISLGYNNLEGNISALNFSKFSQLTKLDLGKNYLTGIIPRSLYSCKSLKAIRITNNKLEGEIHPDILSFKSLSFLSLGCNRWTTITRAMKILIFVGEEMPDNLGMVDFDGFQNLQFLNFHNCQLTGHIPSYLSKLKKL
ncbi:putative non-specific serine/threonine protein kinase [Rosa chinensis]|uniref:Putative non-specific serine/threonine protein kinase n=1 Tax=Rosa chinensis TaxID=74649 RepID=A0A2P6QQA9_ROSCH|nr:putative non-specific serine/threonine protein kinase [Rosa chinensis]